MHFRVRNEALIHEPRNLEVKNGGRDPETRRAIFEDTRTGMWSLKTSEILDGKSSVSIAVHVGCTYACTCREIARKSASVGAAKRKCVFEFTV